jgi:hypothetical protein
VKLTNDWCYWECFSKSIIQELKGPFDGT